MSELSLTVIRVGFLAVLWLFVIAAIGVVRTTCSGRPRPAQPERQAQSTRPRARPARPSRSVPAAAHPRVLVVTDGALKGSRLDLAQQQITLGRANDATLVLNDDYASSRHARIFRRTVSGSSRISARRNGTYLDRQKVTQPTPVPLGVPIRIGKTVLELRR